MAKLEIDNVVVLNTCVYTTTLLIWTFDMVGQADLTFSDFILQDLMIDCLLVNFQKISQFG